MDLKQRIDLYVGGQMEVQNPNEEYLYRGEIERIAVDGDKFKVRFAWLAKGVGYPSLPNIWVKDDRLDYAASLEIYSVSDIGNGRLCLYSPIVGETVILFPKDGSKLDPSNVEGLEAQLK